MEINFFFPLFSRRTYLCLHPHHPIGIHGWPYVSKTNFKTVLLQRRTVFISLSPHRYWECRYWKHWKRRECLLSGSYQPWLYQRLSSYLTSPRHHPCQVHHPFYLSSCPDVSKTYFVTYLLQQYMIFLTFFFCQPYFRLHLTNF